jgi:hypothetical protein
MATEFVLKPDWKQIVAIQTLPGARLLSLRALALAIEICPRGSGASLAGSTGARLYQTHFRTETMDAEIGWIIRVGATKSYAYYVHEGTHPHEIAASTKSALYFFWPKAPGGAGWAFYKHVNHPGTRPQPWLWRAANIVIRSRI